MKKRHVVLVLIALGDHVKSTTTGCSSNPNKEADDATDNGVNMDPASCSAHSKIQKQNMLKQPFSPTSD